MRTQLSSVFDNTISHELMQAITLRRVLVQSVAMVFNVIISPSVWLQCYSSSRGKLRYFLASLWLEDFSVKTFFNYRSKHIETGTHRDANLIITFRFQRTYTHTKYLNLLKIVFNLIQLYIVCVTMTSISLFYFYRTKWNWICCALITTTQYIVVLTN